MDIKELQDRKTKAEADIADILKKFMTASDLVISEVDIDFIGALSTMKSGYVKTGKEVAKGAVNVNIHLVV